MQRPRLADGLRQLRVVLRVTAFFQCRRPFETVYNRSEDMSESLLYFRTNDIYHRSSPLSSRSTAAAGSRAGGTGDLMPPTSRKNAALVRRFLTNVGACGDTNAVLKFLASGASDHQLVFDGARRRDTVKGLEWRALASANVDLHVENVVASDDRVAVRGRVTGAHEASLIDFAPTGRSFEVVCAWFFRIEHERIDTRCTRHGNRCAPGRRVGAFFAPGDTRRSDDSSRDGYRNHRLNGALVVRHTHARPSEPGNRSTAPPGHHNA